MLTYRHTDLLEMVGYLDLDFARMSRHEKVNLRIYLSFAGGVVSWKSVKQSIIASFTMEEEFIVRYEATTKALWLRNFFTGLRIVDL